MLKRVVLVVILAGTAIVGWRGGVVRAADAISDDNVNAAVAAAKTPEDHAALVRCFSISPTGCFVRSLWISAMMQDLTSA